MTNFKYIFKDKKRLILIVSIILICSVSIAIGIYAQVESSTLNKIRQEEAEEQNYDELKSNFEYIFTNSINKEATAKVEINYDELIYCKYDIKEEKDGKYSIDAQIPFFKQENEETQKINNEIFDIFAKKIVEIVQTDTIQNTSYNMDYVVYVNNDILSLVIRCKYKNGRNPQREIIQTYNYNLENGTRVEINDILQYKGLDKEQVQERVNKEIQAINNDKKVVSEQGYNVYMRNENDEIYVIDNTPNFFLGKDNHLYLVYAYGNNNYTSELDLVIF